MIPEISDAWLALIGAVMGGSGLKFIDSWLSRAKVKDDSASKFRDELRAEVVSMREELRKAREDLIAADARSDEWQAKYYELLVKKVDK